MTKAKAQEKVQGLANRLTWPECRNMVTHDKTGKHRQDSKCRDLTTRLRDITNTAGSH